MVIPQYKAPVFVISIGNIIVGGSGKTPFTIYLADKLNKQGFKVAVSHRGYKSQLENAETLISDYAGVLPQTDRAGDEAWLIANRLPGIPVVVGKNRKQAIKLILKHYPEMECVILDDSFQHLKVKHDLDIIIVNQRIGFGNGFVLPAGILREPLRALKNSDMLILNRSSSNTEIDANLMKSLHGYCSEVHSGRYETLSLHDFAAKGIPAAQVSGDKVIMVAGIGSPSGFAASVNALQLKVVASLLLPDHFDYMDESVRKSMLQKLQTCGAKWIITTEKDYAKLRHFQEFSGCLLVIKISFCMDEQESSLLKSIAHKISGKRVYR